MEDDIEEYRSSDPVYDAVESPTPSFPRSSRQNRNDGRGPMLHPQVAPGSSTRLGGHIRGWFLTPI